MQRGLARQNSTVLFSNWISFKRSTKKTGSSTNKRNSWFLETHHFKYQKYDDTNQRKKRKKKTFWNFNRSTHLWTARSFFLFPCLKSWLLYDQSWFLLRPKTCFDFLFSSPSWTCFFFLSFFYLFFLLLPSFSCICTRSLEQRREFSTCTHGTTLYTPKRLMMCHLAGGVWKPRIGRPGRAQHTSCARECSISSSSTYILIIIILFFFRASPFLVRLQPLLHSTTCNTYMLCVVVVVFFRKVFFFFFLDNWSYEFSTKMLLLSDFLSYSCILLVCI